MDLFKVDKLMSIIAIIGPLLGILGWFYFNSVLFLVVGFSLSLFHTWYIWPGLNSGAKGLEVFAAIIGFIISKPFSVPFYVGCMLSICIFDLIMEFLELIYNFVASKYNKKEENVISKNIEEELLEKCRKESITDDYAKQIVKYCPNFEMDLKIAKAFVGIIIIAESRGKEIALDYFDKFIKFEMEKNKEDLGWGTFPSYLCGILEVNNIVNKNESQDLGVKYIEYYTKNYFRLIMEKNSINILENNFCRKCGATLVEGANFCNKCGTKVIWMEDCNNDMSKM